jgi:hypothetical protein
MMRYFQYTIIVLTMGISQLGFAQTRAELEAQRQAIQQEID